MVRRHMFKGRPKQRDQVEREGARFIAGSDPLAYLVGSRGAVQGVHNSKPALEVPSVPATEQKSATYHARQQRKKQRRRERWEAQAAERGATVRGAAVEATPDAERTVAAGAERRLTKQERKDLRKAKASPSTRKLKKIYEEQGVPGSGRDEAEEGEEEDDDDEEEESGSDMGGVHEQGLDEEEEEDSDEEEGEEEEEGQPSAGGRRRHDQPSAGGRRHHETGEGGARKGPRSSRDAGLGGKVRRPGGGPGQQGSASSKAEKRKRIKKQKKAAKAAAAAASGGETASKQSL